MYYGLHLLEKFIVIEVRVCFNLYDQANKDYYNKTLKQQDFNLIDEGCREAFPRYRFFISRK